MYTLLNIFHLGIKELRSLGRDTLMMVMIGFAFSGQIYVVATGLPQSLNKAPIAVIDEDRSPLSARIANAFYPPYFLAPVIIDQYAADLGMDAGLYTFILDIPPDFQRDLLAGRQPAIQLNVDATRISQAFIGNNYVQTIVNGEVSTFVQGHRALATLPIELETRALFNPNLNSTWFGSVMELVNSITALSIVLTGAALIREREHGTIEHLLVMPVTPSEIMLAKVWANGLVIVAAALLSLTLVVRWMLGVTVNGSITLFIFGAAIFLFAMCSLGIALATFARSMPQFGLLAIPFFVVMNMLSGGVTPQEAMPPALRYVMQLAPSTHFTSFSQAVLYRGAGVEVVWPQLAAMVAIGVVLFAVAAWRFRRTMAAAQG